MKKIMTTGISVMLVLFALSLFHGCSAIDETFLQGETEQTEIISRAGDDETDPIYGGDKHNPWEGVWKWVKDLREGYKDEPWQPEKAIMLKPAEDEDNPGRLPDFPPVYLGYIYTEDYLVPNYDIEFILGYEDEIESYDLVWEVTGGGTIVSGQGTPQAVIRFARGGLKALTLSVSHPNVGIIKYSIDNMQIATGNDLTPSGNYESPLSATVKWNGPTMNGSENPWTYTKTGFNQYVEVDVGTDQTTLWTSARFFDHPWGLISTGAGVNATYTYGPITERVNIFLANPNDPGIGGIIR